MAGRRLAYSTMTHNERISALVHEDFLLKGLPLPDVSVCTGHLINIGRISERAEKSKEFSLTRGTFFSSVGENIAPLELLLIERIKKKSLFLSILISNKRIIYFMRTSLINKSQLFVKLKFVNI